MPGAIGTPETEARVEMSEADRLVAETSAFEAVPAAGSVVRAVKIDSSVSTTVVELRILVARVVLVCRD